MDLKNKKIKIIFEKKIHFQNFFLFESKKRPPKKLNQYKLNEI